MIAFEDLGSQVVLVYNPEFTGASWLDEKLNSDGEVTLSHTFTVSRDDLLETTDRDDFLFGDEDTRRFVVGEIQDGYRVIGKDVLGLKWDLFIALSIRLRRQTFVAERDISIFRRIDELTEEQIFIGGSRPGAIPADEFARLLHDFPTSTELTKYSWVRITRVLREYLETMTDAERRLSDYMSRRAQSGVKVLKSARGRISVASELELEKFTYVRDRLVEMLADAESYSEADWQAAVADLFLLIFPQYIAVLHHVQVREWYSNASKPTTRDIDLMLVGANGCVDIIEIKKPFARGLVSRSKYRDNHIPVRELSGALMQAEKYLFYLSKSGIDGERAISAKYAATLPAGLGISITNPKAIIVSGRDDDLSANERFDFEFARRAYSNVIDIVSYDDLLRRLDNIIVSLAARAVGGGVSPAGAGIGEPV